MKRSLRVLTVVLVLLAVVASISTAQSARKDPALAYVLSFFVGFGTGHFYLQDDAATRFLLLDAGSLAATVAGAAIAVSSLYSADPYGTALPAGYTTGLGVMVAGSLAFSAFRLWEFIDVLGSVNEMRTSGRITARPAVEIRPGGTEVGVALSY